MRSVASVLENRERWAVACGDATAWARTLPDACLHCIVTSPPYYALRDYGVEGQMGLEDTPERYIAAMVALFRELRRALHPSGTLWVNIGDSYANNPGNGRGGEGGLKGLPLHRSGRDKSRLAGFKPKDLIGVPWMLAFALRADGWYLRQDIIWHKPSPMPSSVRDRCTTAHEYLFLLSKSPRYYFDATAIEERATNDKPAGNKTHKYQAAYANGDERHRTKAGLVACAGVTYATRNKRSVWRIAPKPFKGAHFACYPPKLVIPCVRAGSSERGVCPACGEPWVRVVAKERKATRPGNDTKVGRASANTDSPNHSHNGTVGNRDPRRHCTVTETVGWRPGCGCGSDDLRPGDLEEIESPTGERAGDDPSRRTGRAGMNRPRGDAEGVRPMTRYEQRKYADQLRESPHKAEMRGEVGDEAFAHYVRTDRSGARPIPAGVLARWVSRGWVVPVELPTATPLDPVPAVVCDPFAGSGTTIQVAVGEGRRAVGCELNEKYHKLIEKRMFAVTPNLLSGV